MRALPGPIGLGPTRLDPLARRSAFERLARRWRALLPLAALCLLALTALPASAQTFPPLSGRVVDAAQLLDAATEADLTQKLAAFEERSSDQVVVATVPDLQGTDIADYGYRLGRAWGIGREGENNGVILLVSKGDRKVRIEVGYGLEGTLTDALSRLVIENDILPRFRANDYAGGILAGTEAILQIVGGNAEEVKQRAERNGGWQEGNGEGWFGLVVILFILFVAVGPIVLAFLARLFGGGGGRGGPGSGLRQPARRRRRAGPISPGWGGGFGGGSGWGGGSSGGGGFSGGGGSFGGGGASGSW
ncbi:TPM domain-containing protein [Aureimonas ureilytica]|uniref:TPM domain-containing protein n=1 Tax=Aureimonas ureilytica TaxID=401562 RepID=UPI003CEACA25